MKIAIAGYGVEGEQNYAYWSQDPSNDITIVDQSETPSRPLPEGVTTYLAPDAFEHLQKLLEPTAARRLAAAQAGLPPIHAEVPEGVPLRRQVPRPPLPAEVGLLRRADARARGLA